MSDAAEQAFARTEPAQHTFETIVGQDLVKQFLVRAIERGRLSQALMFTGPAGVGKHSLMFALAKHLVSLDFAPDSPEAERARGKVERGTHPDVIVVEPTGRSGQIRREQIDELQERAYYAPLESSRKVIMLSPAEALNLVSANNLLKILEEPPRSVTFLLSCCQPHRVLTTIRSRCAALRCPPVESHAVAAWLSERLRCPESMALTAARLAGGRPGVAWEIITGQDGEKRRQITHSLAFFRKHGYPSVFKVGNDLLAALGHVDEAMAFLEVWFRDLLVRALVGDEAEELLINGDLSEQIAEAIAQSSPEGFAGALEKVLACQKRYGRRPYIDGDLVMENLLTDLGIALKT